MRPGHGLPKTPRSHPLVTVCLVHEGVRAYVRLRAFELVGELGRTHW